MENAIYTLDDLLSGPPLASPLLPDLAAAVYRAADAVEAPEHRRALAWALRSYPCRDALRVLRALSEAAGQSEAAEDPAAVGIDLPGACKALRMAREAEEQRFDQRRLTHDASAPLWYLRVDAYGLATYGAVRGWCLPLVAMRLRALANIADLREADEHEIGPALDAVAIRAQKAADAHSAEGIGRELWSALSTNAAIAAGWVTRWKK